MNVGWALSITELPQEARNGYLKISEKATGKVEPKQQNYTNGALPVLPFTILLRHDDILFRPWALERGKPCAGS
jgi:hypothetical protein